MLLSALVACAAGLTPALHGAGAAAPPPAALVAPPDPAGAPAGTISAPPGPGTGFRPETWAAEEKWEAILLRTPTPESLRKHLRVLTEEPHAAGTQADYETAVYVRDRMKELGFESEIETYHVLLNYPKAVALRLALPEEMELPTREEGIPGDKDSYSLDAFPGFHGYGASGTARAEVVYANYGRKEDFEKLESLGVPVKGRIVLVRYGELFRGLKVLYAQERGAAGVLIFSDPADDGYMKGDIVPDGPFRPPDAIQRGSVQFLSYGPGDPGTPGWASTKDAKRIPYEKLDTISRIPSLPIGYGPAGEILSRLAGQEVPAGWQGGLPFAYHTGPGPAEIDMSVEMDYAVRPIWNVITRIPGAVEPDLEVVIGNHRDAWTYGAVDPNSGTAAILEMAKGLSEAMKAGWKPRRTLVLASWDGEEYGLLGSTEWAEEHAGEIEKRVVAYINMDSAVSGADLGMGGVPSLRNLVFSAAASVTDPRKGKTLYELWEEKKRDAWASSGPIDRSDPASLLRFDPQLDPLGSGSDYTVFLDHLGVASVDVRLSGRYGVYHSIYDDLYWMENFCDPEMIHHATATRLLGLVAMRASTAELFPFRFAPIAAALGLQLEELQTSLLRKMRKAKPADKKQPVKADWTALDRALSDLGDAGTALDAALETALAAGRAGGTPADGALRAANAAMRDVERTLIDPEGLPGRTWFRHLVTAPGLSTGYAPWPFPGIRQAIEESDQAMFDREAPRIEARLRAAASALRAIAALDGLRGGD